MADIRILVAMHKAYRLPEDALYAPIQVGGARIPGLEQALRDDTGENISSKNSSYCELTALYWAWKNMTADVVGLVHYRRYFARKGFARKKFDRIAAKADMEAALAKAPVILPTKRNYWIETTYSQYIHAHHKEDLDAVEDILTREYPEYLPAYTKVMGQTSGHRFNMLVMRRDILDRYCSWLFDVLAKAEVRIDTQAYDAYNGRVFGFLGERLLDVWIETNQIPYTELPVVFLENQHWLKKGTAFLRRKFMARKPVGTRTTVHP